VRPAPISAISWAARFHDARGRTLVAHVLERWPDARPRRILDLGCMTGTSTLPWCTAFPEAELHALDTSAPVLRYAHARAEALGAAVHFHQQNAEHTTFEDGSFDIVVSHVFLHETSARAVPQIFRECRRLLRPGGIMAHLEVPVRAELLGYWDYVRSAREGRYNQEPYWIGVTSADLAAIAREAGFAEVGMGFQDVPNGSAAGAGFKPLAEGKFALSNWFVVSGVR
jgi:SAM-dependent methyltransferase